ncbi:cysteine proteinase [Alternaria burnsii]|uniref:Cysteine proteinase n=1 Tax=Alternaria burnsii TaxID=1187904 RepID=A0A8H7EBM1_9PLEO|nr:cysteine proteinase [Alternaria burnsii]KAF7673748.1 cysteine proteinase [Alternaria burnsii]
MASNGTHNDFINITTPHSRAPSMVQETPASAPRPRLPVRKQAPQRNIDEFWNKFTTKHPGKIFTILPDNLYAKRAAAHAPKGSIPGVNALASYEEAKEACTRKVAKIVKECRRLNQKYRDPHFDIEADFKRSQAFPDTPADCLTGLNEEKTDFHPLSVKRVEDIFDDPRFYIGGATANDVRQGNDGDCWFMSALATISNKEELIQRVCVARDEKVGVYGFVFHRDGEWISEVIDDKLYLIKEDFDEAKLERYHWLELQNRKSPEDEYRTVMQTGSRALYFAQCSDPNETWLPLLEKAFAKAHGDYSAIDGGFVGEGIEDLTGGVTSEVFATDILDKDKFWREELMNVNKTFLFGCGQMGGIYGARKGIQEKHAYSVMEAREIDGQRLLKLRNPWGRTEWTGRWSDGSEEWTPEWMKKLDHKFGDDGVFWISYKDLLRTYQHFDRTRLFGPEWTVSQQWTSVNVPWSVDYLDTKFRIHLAKGGPVVIVLSQLDDRYYQGLEGQYEFHLQFRLHKDDEEEYIVRSNGTYYMKRSVSTELDLEAGNYTVLLKIKATRIPDNPTPDEVIRATCTKRREKLLAIGLSYDLAHAKGQFREQEKDKAQREKEQKAERKKAELRLAHERRKRLRRKAELREQKKAAKETRKLNRSGEMAEVERKLHDLSGLGINVDEDNRTSGDEEVKPVHQAVSRHRRTSSLDPHRERSASPGGGFGGRGGYNKGRDGYNASLPGTFQGRGGYNRDSIGAATSEATTLQSRSGYHSSQTSPAAHSQGFQGRGGYNQNMPGEFQGRGGYNQNMPGEFQGRGGYNQLPGEFQGRGGYNNELPGTYQGRDGYNEGQVTDSPIPTPLPTPLATPMTDEFRPGTPGQRTFSPRPERRSPAASRRATLTPIPGVRPGIQVTRGRSASDYSHRAQNGMHSPEDMSDSSSWDSEIDGPCSLDSDHSDDEDNIPRIFSERQPRYVWYNGARYPYIEDKDEFERDPWNAVCVVGLRVFSKDNTDVTIEVHNGEGESRKKSDGDDASVTTMGTVRRKEKELDVDDSAADATSPMRKRNTGLEDELSARFNRDEEAELVSHVGTAPAGMERSRQGTLS